MPTSLVCPIGYLLSSCPPLYADINRSDYRRRISRTTEHLTVPLVAKQIKQLFDMYL